MDFREPTIQSEVKFTGNVINLRVDTIKLPNGKEATREIVEHPGGVAVLPIDENGVVYLVRQFRKPFEIELLEAPAGKLSIGEDHFACGVRELEEETGFRSSKITYLGYAVPTPGFATEKIYLYLAQELTQVAQNLDEDEFLSVESYQFDEVVKMCLNGEIVDAKTIIAVLMAKELIK